jgi:hypothetical protein
MRTGARPAGSRPCAAKGGIQCCGQPRSSSHNGSKQLKTNHISHRESSWDCKRSRRGQHDTGEPVLQLGDLEAEASADSGSTALNADFAAGGQGSSGSTQPAPREESPEWSA